MRIKFDRKDRFKICVLALVESIESITLLVTLGSLHLEIYEKVLFSDWMQGEH